MYILRLIGTRSLGAGNDMLESDVQIRGLDTDIIVSRYPYLIPTLSRYLDI